MEAQARAEMNRFRRHQSRPAGHWNPEAFDTPHPLLPVILQVKARKFTLGD
jgi:hypothetical protein